MPGTVILPYDGQLQMLSWNIASNILSYSSNLFTNARVRFMCIYNIKIEQLLLFVIYSIKPPYTALLTL